MRVVAAVVAGLLAMGPMMTAVPAAEPGWDSWNSDRGQMVLKFDGDVLIGQGKAKFLRFELERKGEGIWQGTYAVRSGAKVCSEGKLGGLYWGSLTLTFDPKLENFTAKSDLCGTDQDPAGDWKGQIVSGD